MPSQTFELYDGTNTYTFDVEGDFTWNQQYEHREACEPSELIRIVETWRIERALITLQAEATGTTATDNAATWTKINTLLAHLEDRATTPPTHARIRGAGGALQRTLGPSTFQHLRIKDVDWLRSPEFGTIEPGCYEVALQVNLELEAERVFEDDDGLVDFRQTVKYTNAAGLQRVEWVTFVETKEGVNAETKARTFGLIDAATDFGSDYWYVTSGNTGVGVDVEVLDADERSTARGSSEKASVRTPTRARATCVIQQSAMLLGAPSAGASLSAPFVETLIETDRFTRRTTTTARAQGPGALTFVEAQAPSRFTIKTQRTELAQDNLHERVWVYDELLMTIGEISATITGGHKDKAFRKLTGNKRPVLQIGSFAPWDLRVEVRIEAIGAFSTPADILMPEKLGDPWEFFPNESGEHVIPHRLEPSTNASQQRWDRVGTYVYRSNDDGNGLNLTDVSNRLLGAVKSQSLIAPPGA